jgi:bifunctional DNase/RNase/DNA-binding transcriptional MerR regulator
MGTDEPTRWRVGQLAAATGVTVRSLHHYDEIGLLVASDRTTGGHRLYGEADVQRLYRILALRRLGFALNEVAALLDADRPDLRETVRRHLAEVERDLAQQRQLRQRLAEILSALERSVQPSIDQFIGTVEAMAMIETTIADVVGHVHTHERLPGKPHIAPVDTRIVLLKEAAGERMLPICVARSEQGFMLVAHLAGGTFSRPVTEDLAARLIELSGARIERVAIDAFRDHTFYATVTMRVGEDSHEVDARPSDALNLAARLGCPIFVEPGIMDTCAIASDAEVEAYLRDFESRPGNVEGPGEWQSLVDSVRRGLDP